MGQTAEYLSHRAEPPAYQRPKTSSHRGEQPDPRPYFRHTPQLPPSLAQCLQYLQFLQALQFFAPVQVASGCVYAKTVKDNIKAATARNNSVNIDLFILQGLVFIFDPT
jgi:hypothetical protein